MPFQHIAWSSVVSYIPFVGLAVSNSESGTPIVTRLVEASIIGGVVLYGTVQFIGAKVDNLAANQKIIQGQIAQIQHDMYRPAWQAEAEARRTQP